MSRYRTTLLMESDAKKKNADFLLWNRFKNGDKEIFASLYQAHIASLIAYGSKLCPDKEVLKDLIQELFVELWNSRKNLAATDCIRFYLLKALRYKLIRAEKRQQTRTGSLSKVIHLVYKEVENPVETTIIEKENRDFRISLLQEAIKKLTLRQQEAIQLRFYQGLRHEQIAEIMDMNYQSVSNLLYSAISRLKEKINSTALISLILVIFLFQ